MRRITTFIHLCGPLHWYIVVVKFVQSETILYNQRRDVIENIYKTRINKGLYRLWWWFCVKFVFILLNFIFIFNSTSLPSLTKNVFLFASLAHSLAFSPEFYIKVDSTVRMKEKPFNKVEWGSTASSFRSLRCNWPVTR